jgi:hypothetical protein
MDSFVNVTYTTSVVKGLAYSLPWGVKSSGDKGATSSQSVLLYLHRLSSQASEVDLGHRESGKPDRAFLVSIGRALFAKPVRISDKERNRSPYECTEICTQPAESSQTAQSLFSLMIPSGQ